MRLISKVTKFISLLFIFNLANADTPVLRLAMTHTTDNSGLMALLNPVFESHTGIKVNAITVSSGQALRLGMQGDADVLLTHAPDDEIKFIEAGFGINRQPVMYNDYVILGPSNDPANISESQTPDAALATIMNSASLFISRGDQSGTHKKELAIWSKLSITPKGKWYLPAGIGMGQALLLASDRQAYILSDRATWIAFQDRSSLKLLFEAEALLKNSYHVYAVNPEKHSHVQLELAKQYIEFITGPIGQQVIADFRIEEQLLFKPVYLKNQEENLVQEEQQRSNYFVDAMLSASKLIFDFDTSLYLVVWTSLKVSLLAVLFASVISIPLGIIVALNQFRGKNLLLACLNTLMALPTVVVGLLLYGLLNRQGLLGDYGLLYTPAAIVIGQCVLIIPVVWNLSIAAVNGADRRLAKTCTSLGATHIQRSFIYMSEVRFALVAAVVAGFGRAIGEVGIAMMLGGNIAGLSRTMTTAIALETSKGDFEFALALGFMLLLVAFIVNIVLHLFQIKNR